MRLLRPASVHMARSDQEVEPGMAKEVFEMRTVKEIKDVLDRCISDDKPCSSCVYDKFEAFKFCIDMMLIDTRNCICELEAKVPKWVSVKDRLPDKESMLCLVVSNGDLYVSHWHWSGGGPWFFTDGEYDCNVTHWAKAPELPKEEEAMLTEQFIANK